MVASRTTSMLPERSSTTVSNTSAGGDALRLRGALRSAVFAFSLVTMLLPPRRDQPAPPRLWLERSPDPLHMHVLWRPPRRAHRVCNPDPPRTAAPRTPHGPVIRRDVVMLMQGVHPRIAPTRHLHSARPTAPRARFVVARDHFLAPFFDLFETFRRPDGGRA